MIDCSLSLVNAVLTIAQRAGDAILQVYNHASPLDVTHKDDNSPVTQADLMAHQLISEQLAALQPTLPILSEESPAIDYATRKQWLRYWLVDPLDGTKEFLAHNGEFTVNIALIEEGRPILGVVVAPVQQLSYFASNQIGAFKQQGNSAPSAISVRRADKGNIIVTTSRHHGSKQQKLADYLPRYFLHYQTVTMGSSLKFCLIAEGKADFYPRLGPTSEWDTAAAHCILEQAGGVLMDFNFQPLEYNRKESLLNPEFLALGDKGLLKVLQG